MMENLQSPRRSYPWNAEFPDDYPLRIVHKSPVVVECILCTSFGREDSRLDNLASGDKIRQKRHFNSIARWDKGFRGSSFKKHMEDCHSDNYERYKALKIGENPKEAVRKFLIPAEKLIDGKLINLVNYEFALEHFQKYQMKTQIL